MALNDVSYVFTNTMCGFTLERELAHNCHRGHVQNIKALLPIHHLSVIDFASHPFSLGQIESGTSQLLLIAANAALTAEFF